MIFGLTNTWREREREQEERVQRKKTWVPPSKKTHSRRTHTQRKKTHPSSRARRGYFADPSLILTNPSHSADPFLIVTNPMNDPPLSQPDRQEQPTPKPICPPCEQPTPRSDHPMSDPLLNRAATFRSTHHIQVATIIATTKSPTNLSLSLSVLGFRFFCFDFCFFDCLYILILHNNICLDPQKMWKTQ